MEGFLKNLYSEIDTEKRLLDYHTTQLQHAPEGFLEVTLACDGPVYYWYFPEGSSTERCIQKINISDDADLIAELIRKDLSCKIVEIITDNLPLMEAVALEYLDIHGTLS